MEKEPIWYGWIFGQPVLKQRSLTIESYMMQSYGLTVERYLEKQDQDSSESTLQHLEKLLQSVLKGFEKYYDILKI